ncbi:hypothetical protein AKG33_01150 [Dichelobacter nodosus]|nr:hypothetical protein AKG33_01150 [Dichelobacter nodosus]
MIEMEFDFFTKLSDQDGYYFLGMERRMQLSIAFKGSNVKRFIGACRAFTSAYCNADHFSLSTVKKNNTALSVKKARCLN